jgi:hypothetical protein
MVPAVDAALVPSGRGGRRPVDDNDGQSPAADLPPNGSGRATPRMAARSDPTPPRAAAPTPTLPAPMTAFTPGSTRAARVPDGSLRPTSGSGSSSRAAAGRVTDELDDEAIEAEALAAGVHAPRMVAAGTRAAGMRRADAPIACPRRPAGSGPGSATAMAG